jgi:hypothetical protein
MALFLFRCDIHTNDAGLIANSLACVHAHFSVHANKRKEV